jgi:hypothetical protein
VRILGQIAKEIKLKPRLLIKFKFIEQQASKGNAVAKQYLEKLKREQVSIDWAHRVLINSIRQQRMLKMMAIADDRHFRYDNENDLVQFIASEMQKEGLDLNNEGDLDGQLLALDFMESTLSYTSNPTTDSALSGIFFIFLSNQYRRGILQRPEMAVNNS